MSEEKIVEELMSENDRLRQAYKYIHASRNSVDEELNNAQKENASLRDQLSERQQQLDATLRNTTRLLDQLSKEREFNEKLKQGLENGSERWKKHLELENKITKEQLQKEREMRKELVSSLKNTIRNIALDASGNSVVYAIEALLTKPSELDKNE